MKTLFPLIALGSLLSFVIEGVVVEESTPTDENTTEFGKVNSLGNAYFTSHELIPLPTPTQSLHQVESSKLAPIRSLKGLLVC